jgi:hypothetical protein
MHPNSNVGKKSLLIRCHNGALADGFSFALALSADDALGHVLNAMNLQLKIRDVKMKKGTNSISIELDDHGTPIKIRLKSNTVTSLISQLNAKFKTHSGAKALSALGEIEGMLHFQAVPAVAHKKNRIPVLARSK